MANTFRQCKLSRGNVTMTCWLQQKDGLKEGSVVDVETNNQYQPWKIEEVGAIDYGYLSREQRDCEMSFLTLDEDNDYVISSSEDYWI